MNLPKRTLAISMQPIEELHNLTGAFRPKKVCIRDHQRHPQLLYSEAAASS